MELASLSSFFSETARNYPDVICVEYEAEQLTYAELDKRSDIGAHILQSQYGIGPDVLVGICLEKSTDMAVTVLAVLKAGGAYVPLDPQYPQERLSLLLREADLSVVIATASQKLPPLPSSTRCLLPQKLETLSTTPLSLFVPPLLTPENLAYVLYTSGSTGVPKGVAMCISPLAKMISWQVEQSKNLKIGTKTLQFASLSFDVSFQEMFATWAAGGTLVLVNEKTRRDFSALLPFIIENNIERIFLPFVALSHLCEAARIQNRWPVALREVITAGEQLQITPAVRQFFTQCNKAVLVNQYGPSETHVVTSYTLTGDPSTWPALPPIGKPLPYVTTKIGEDEELLLGGDCLARGYLNRPELTEKRFVKLTEGRFYKTGDQVRLEPSGNWQYLGRLDTQVKIRGHRVELGEIEARLTEVERVEQAIVLVEESTVGDKVLVAYLRLTKGESVLTGAQMRQFLGATLPDYMVPTAFIAIDQESFPLTPSGKVDRKAVALLEGTRLPSGTVFEAPQNEKEQQITSIWQEILGIESIGQNDNFFDLGGHSLQLIHLQESLQVLLEREIPITLFFQYPTIRTFARYLREENLSSSSGRSMMADRAARQRAAMNQARHKRIK